MAAVSLCNDEASGVVFAKDGSLEIMPLNNRLKRMLDLWKEVRAIFSQITDLCDLLKRSAIYFEQIF